MFRSVLFSVVALAAAGTALAHDGERWDRGGHERQEWHHDRGEYRHGGDWRREHYDRDERYEGYRGRGPVVRYYAPAYYGSDYYAPDYYAPPPPRYYRYPPAYAYGQYVAPGIGFNLVIPLH